jgi:hypothetical protein
MKAYRKKDRYQEVGSRHELLGHHCSILSWMQISLTT